MLRTLLTFLRKLKEPIKSSPSRTFREESFLESHCTLNPYNQDILKSRSFDCGDSDLNDFFINDYLDYSAGLFGKTYCFIDDSTDDIVCAFSLSNDSIKNNLLPNATRRKVKKRVAHSKHGIKSYPAVLVGRLGVSESYRGKKIGNELMDFIKGWFINPRNKTGCRFVVVDAYNKDYVLKYYQDNDFVFLFTQEEDEAEFMGLDRNTPLKTRIMFFDLIRLKATA